MLVKSTKGREMQKGDESKTHSPAAFSVPS